VRRLLVAERPALDKLSCTASAAGFTLLEVMAAVAILALALTVISASQQAGMRHVIRAKKMTVASLLAREKMTDLEDELTKDGFPEFDEEEEGEFEDGFEGYTYRWKIEKIEMPSGLDPEAMTGALSGEGDDSAGAAGGGMAAFGGQMLTQQFELFRNILERSIRRVTLEVGWKEGGAKKSVEIALYLTDPRQIGAAMSPAAGAGIPGAPGVGSSAGGAAGSTTGGAGRSTGSTRSSRQ
jgi:general secretion pathway protein I